MWAKGTATQSGDRGQFSDSVLLNHHDLRRELGKTVGGLRGMDVRAEHEGEPGLVITLDSNPWQARRFGHICALHAIQGSLVLEIREPRAGSMPKLWRVSPEGFSLIDKAALDQLMAAEDSRREQRRRRAESWEHVPLAAKDIDSRIEAIPQSKRPGILFPQWFEVQAELAGRLTVFYNNNKARVKFEGLVGLVAAEEKLYLGCRQLDGSTEFTEVYPLGYRVIHESALPEEALRYFDGIARRKAGIVEALSAAEISGLAGPEREITLARQHLAARETEAAETVYRKLHQKLGITFVAIPENELASELSSRAPELRALLRTIPGKANYFDDADQYLLGQQQIPNEAKLLYTKAPMLVFALNRSQGVIGYIYAVQARATYSSGWLGEYTYKEMERLAVFKGNERIQAEAFYMGHWAVRPDQQGQGVGFMLTRALLNGARARGIEYLTGASAPGLVEQITQGTFSIIGAAFKRDSGDVRVPFLVRV